MQMTKRLQKTNKGIIEHRIYLVEELRLQNGITLPEWFKITKSQLTDLVQVGKCKFSNLHPHGSMYVTVDMIDCYQQVHIWKSVEKENHPQGLKEITAQEALSYSTGIQIMEEAS